MVATIDIQAVQSVEHPERGIARYVTELVKAIEVAHAASICHYVYNPNLPIPIALAPLARDSRLMAATDLRHRSASVHLVTSPFEGGGFDEILPPPIRLGSVALAVMLYDLIPLRFPQHYLRDPVTRRRYTARAELVRSADAVLAISEQTARDAVELLRVSPRRIHVVGCAPSTGFGAAVDRDGARAAIQGRFPALSGPFVLYPAGADWRKNIGGLLDAWAHVVRQRPDDCTVLVITGQLRDQHEDLAAQVERAGLDSRVLFPGRVTEEELERLYQTAELVVFPSRFEGYGLPVMEARRSGTAVIASRNSSLVELLPDDSLFDPENPQDVATHILRALHDPEWRTHLEGLAIPDGHTWPEVADRTSAVLDALHRPHLTRTRRPKVGVVSPLPPVPSGVADHTMRLLEALRHHADVHAFTDSLDLARTPDGVGLHQLGHLGRASAARGQFDGIVHCWGNSFSHARMLPVMRTWPGIVLAHDVAVAGLYDRCSIIEPDLVDQATFTQLLRREYGDRLPAALRDLDGLTYVDADAHGLTMAGAVIDWSDRYLVHSEAAAVLARAERPGVVSRVGVTSFAFPAAHARPRADRVGEPPVLATFGIVSLTKCVDTVIDVFAAVSKRHPTAILAFVGEVGHGLRDELQLRAEKFGVEHRLVFTGRVPPETYEHWLSIADVAVQLRRSWGGEASAATADVMAWGIPTLVSEVGWAAELPSDSVSRVRAGASVTEVAGAVSELLTDTDLRAHRSHAAIAHAVAHSFDRLAVEVLELITA